MALMASPQTWLQLWLGYGGGVKGKGYTSPGMKYTGSLLLLLRDIAGRTIRWAGVPLPL